MEPLKSDSSEPLKLASSVADKQNWSLTRTLRRFITNWRWRRKLPSSITNSYSLCSTMLTFVIVVSSLIPTIFSHPVFSSQSDCDWNGRGPSSPSSSASRSIQTILFRCSRGKVNWEDPKGGLRVQISPNLHPPYKLCLEDGGRMLERSSSQKNRHRILLEESSGRLLQVLSSEMKNSDCYQILGTSVVLYVESHGGGVSQTNQVMSSTGESRLISLSYEVEPLRGNGDPCRPCSEAEALKAYCSADVVARGYILQIIPGKQYDWIYIKSDLVLHQNQPVFTEFTPPMINFLTTKPRRFDVDKPQPATRMSRGQAYQGIISHPTTCSASVGDGDFLWLIKFRFGMPVTDCVLYWDKWVDLATRGEGECPLSIGQEN